MSEIEGREARIERLRRRYEALKAEGAAPATLPGRSPLPAPAVPDTALILTEELPAGWYWTGVLNKGEVLRIVNVTGRAAVAFTAWNRHEPTERFYHGDTVKIQWTTRLEKGRVLLSEMGRVIASIVEDSCGAHDVLVGGSTAASTARQFGPGPWRNTRDNLLGAVAKFGLSRRDIPPTVSFFAAAGVDGAGAFTWRDGARQAGDFVELRAEMDLLVALSNCPHPLDPASAFDPGPVKLTRYRAPAAGAGDLCRTATAEARRAFENTDSPAWA
jgi:urea carboxylase-associated protein 2